jgi:presequence protease
MNPAIGDMIAGFRVQAVTDVREYASTGILLEHEKTGCQAYHLLNDDSENLFSFVFRTPPADNSGVAHILEHAVLSGSRNHQVKDPFIALMKGSVNTFLNAMTYPDKTVFPAASTVEKDYFNLLSVYGDAVFYPLLRKEVFHQEGCRISLDDDGAISVEGVVYNEMKGNYSSHDSIVGEWSYRSLFPDSPYRFDSGGEPGAIRDLTYEEFVELHAQWYHPSNCQLFFYGNIPTERSLEFVAHRFLDGFDRREIDTSVPLQPPLPAGVNLTLTSPLAAEEAPQGKSTITINWIVGTIDDPFRVLGLEVLAEILLGNPGAPMQKAIVESGLGEDLSPVSGLDTDTRELVFSFGIRGTDVEKVSAFETLIYAELRKLADEGLPPDAVSGALRRVEFRNREIKGGVPFGLRLLGKTLRGWLHGRRPETSLEFAPWMERLKNEVAASAAASAAAKPGFFENLIIEAFLDNNQRSIATVVPSSEHEADEKAELESWKKQLADGLTDEDRARIQEDQRVFDVFQETDDTDEGLASIPSLSITDIPDRIESIPTEQGDLDGVPFYSLDVFTNGITYVDMVFDVQDIDGDLLPLFPLFCRAVSGGGLSDLRYDEVARQLAIKTGGFAAYLEVNSIDGYGESVDSADGHRSRSFVVFRLKSLETGLSDAMDLISRLIISADFSDRARMKDILLEFRNDVKSQILPAGSSFTSLRAGAHLSPVLAREEIWKGIDQAQFLYRAADEIDERLPEMCRGLEELRRRIITKDRLTVNLTADGSSHGRARSIMGEFVDKLPAGTGAETAFVLPAGPEGPRFESLITPSMVGYVSTVFPAAPFLSLEHAHEVVAAQLLKTDYLWEQVRMRGGAYGVSASVNGGEMLFSFSSYRDPSIAETLDAYRGGLDWLIEKGVSAQSLEKAVISIVGRDLRPLSPGEKGIIGFRRRLYDIKDELRQRKRDELRRSTPDQIRDTAARLRRGFESSYSVVMTGEDALDLLPPRYSGLKENRIGLV